MSKRSNQKRKERMKRERPAQRAAAATVVSDQKDETPDPAAFEVPEDYLAVPKETSKMRFVLTLVLIIFLLLVFAIPGALLGGSGGGAPSSEAFMRWTTPLGTQHELSQVEYRGEMQIFHQTFGVMPFAAFSLGITDRQPNEHQLARILVLDSLAVEAGVDISRTELGQHIRETVDMLGMTPEVYKQRAAQSGGIELVEHTVRRALRAARYLQLVGHAGALPDPAKIDEFWNAEHEQLAFDYISLAVEDMREEAKKELPDDDALSAWLGDQPENESDELKTPERRKAEFVFFKSTDDTPGTALVTEFPDTTERTPEEAGEEYYNRVYFTRFTRSEADLKEGETLTPENRYLSQEETTEQKIAEAPVYFAMQAWLVDLQQRQAAGETIDLAADAERLGLGYATVDFKTREEYVEDPFFSEDESTDTMLNYAFQAAAGGFGWSIATTKKRLVITRTSEIEERKLPEFSEIRDKVVDMWTEPKAEELATAKLQEAWDNFEELVKEAEEEDLPEPEGPFRTASAEAFKKAAEAGGLNHGHRDYVDKGGKINDDPNWEEAPNKFIATHKDYYGLDVDEVGAPRTARDKSAVYLIRMDGKLPVSTDLMQATDYENYKSRARSAALGEVGEALDYETLVLQFGLWLLSDEWDDEEEAAENAAEATAEATGEEAGDSN